MKVLRHGVSRLWMQCVVCVDWCPFDCVLCVISLIREMECSLLCVVLKIGCSVRLVQLPTHVMLCQQVSASLAVCCTSNCKLSDVWTCCQRLL